jgi:hypothetical protein
VLTTLPGSAPPPVPAPVADVLIAALLGGLLAAFVTGVDFPRSQRRFSKLA